MDYRTVYTLSGLTTENITELDLADLAALHGYGDTLDRLETYRLAIHALRTVAARTAGMVGVTQVEDIAVRYEDRVKAWLDLADRLQGELDGLLEADDGGPFTVEFMDRGLGSVEAVERGFNSF